MIDGTLFTPNSTLFRLLALLLSVTIFVSSTGCLAPAQPGMALANSNHEDLPADRAESPEMPRPTARAIATQDDLLNLTLEAASGKTILFLTQNGQAVQDVPAQSLDIPHLVLYRNGQLTDPIERSLSVKINDLDVPPSGMTISLALETQHEDPDLVSAPRNRIVAWSYTLPITNATGMNQTAGANIALKFEFADTLPETAQPVQTPTDYYRLVLTLQDARQPYQSQTFILDYAFLLESQWITPLPQVQESAPGAAPKELMIYACDMFLPQKSEADAGSRISRQGFSQFLRDELIPRMVTGFQTQTDTWKYPWSPAWSSYRSGDDVERLSVALTDDDFTWYHGVAPSLGNSGISIALKSWDTNQYDLLVEGLMSTYHHELFHSLQGNLSQTITGIQDMNGNNGSWHYYLEGMASFASSVGQPELEFGSTSVPRGYVFNARQFVAGPEPGLDLNTSIQSMNPYHAALYWRFLYEKCGGMSQGVEDQASGMRIIRSTLETLFSGEIMDMHATNDVVTYTPAVMNKSLANSACPFQTYEESLVAFARAIYSLHLQGGRCTAPSVPAGCEFYDPNSMYAEPPLTTITFTGLSVDTSQGDQAVPVGIPNSFGMDLIDVELKTADNIRSVTLEISMKPDSVAQFSVQIVQLKDVENGQPQPVAGQPVFSATLNNTSPDGRLTYTIEKIDKSVSNRLGVIITRLDNLETVDPVGAFKLMIHP